MARPLDEYRKKRDFSKTPEPTGDAAGALARGPLFFCVQKHLASHLHYDLRLEWNGVLLSWAVPKGPSLDPTDKRLAMHVEDHPVEYGAFEGVIPQGYGAGIVMLWDRGTWQPQVADVDAALKKGDLKFTLDGFKLKGSWVLVRTGGYGSRGGPPGRSWLLIKHRDEWSGALDITTFAPLSVKTPDADLADILAADHPEVWRNNPPAKTGDTGAMFERVISQAFAIKLENTAARERDQPSRRGTVTRSRAKKQQPKAPRTSRRKGSKDKG
ncbi:MAG: DNA polymerase ligase N-terminal domain-containing protein [Acidobacteriota bacterium]